MFWVPMIDPYRSYSLQITIHHSCCCCSGVPCCLLPRRLLECHGRDIENHCKYIRIHSCPTKRPPKHIGSTRREKNQTEQPARSNIPWDLLIVLPVLVLFDFLPSDWSFDHVVDNVGILYVPLKAPSSIQFPWNDRGCTLERAASSPSLQATFPWKVEEP